MPERRLDDTGTLPDEPLISVVTLAELSVGPLVAPSDDERAARQAHLQQAEADFDPSCSTRLQLAALGRWRRRFAATALAHELPVYTCNPDDFSGVRRPHRRRRPRPGA